MGNSTRDRSDARTSNPISWWSPHFPICKSSQVTLPPGAFKSSATEHAHQKGEVKVPDSGTVLILELQFTSIKRRPLNAPPAGHIFSFEESAIKDYNLKVMCVWVCFIGWNYTDACLIHGNFQRPMHQKSVSRVHEVTSWAHIVIRKEIVAIDFSDSKWHNMCRSYQRLS